jgi:hypothetical protein
MGQVWNLPLPLQRLSDFSPQSAPPENFGAGLVVPASQFVHDRNSVEARPASHVCRLDFPIEFLSLVGRGISPAQRPQSVGRRFASWLAALSIAARSPDPLRLAASRRTIGRRCRCRHATARFAAPICGSCARALPPRQFHPEHERLPSNEKRNADQCLATGGVPDRHR